MDYVRYEVETSVDDMDGVFNVIYTRIGSLVTITFYGYATVTEGSLHYLPLGDEIEEDIKQHLIFNYEHYFTVKNRNKLKFRRFTIDCEMFCIRDTKVGDEIKTFSVSFNV